MNAIKSFLGFVWRLALVLVLTALAGELYLYCRGAAVADDYIADPVLFFSPDPGTRPSEEDANVLETVEENGMRRSRANPQYTKPHRVLVSGCSYTFGVGVPDNETYVWRLNELCPTADFDNLGVSGYGPYRSYLRQGKYLKNNRYDLLVYAMQNNHLERDAMPHLTFTHSDNKSDLVALPFVEMRGDHQFVEHPLEFTHWPGDMHSRLINFLRNFTLLTRERLIPCPDEKQRAQIFAYIVNKMASQAHQYGAKFVLAVLNTNPVPTEYFSPDIAIINIAYNNGADLPAELRVRGNPRNHPNGKVHEHWACSLASQLAGLHYLDAPQVNSQAR